MQQDSRDININVLTPNNTAIAPGDSLETALGKTQGQINAISANGVTSQFQDGGPHTETAVTTYNNSKSSDAIVRNSGKGQTYAHYYNSSIFTIGNSTFTSNLVVVNWTTVSDTNATANGFANDGLLTEVRIGNVLETVAGAKIQAWIVRPVTLGASGATSSFTIVQAIGEIDASSQSRWHVFRGLAIPVKAGDMIAARGININLPYTSGDATATNYRNIKINVADLSATGLTGTISGTTSTVRAWLFEADIINSSLLAVNTPYAHLRLNAAGYIPNRLGRQPDLPLQGKKIIWVGTSIPANFGTTSYPAQVGVALDTKMVNEAVGSSGMVWDGTRALSLSPTQAELTAAGFSPLQSYEVKLIGKAPDIVVLDHGHNDRVQAASNAGVITAARTGTITSSTSSATVTGTSTLFTTELAVGNKLFSSDFKAIGTILSIQSNTSLTLAANAVTAFTNKNYVSMNMDRTTYYGAFNYVIQALYADNPGVRIVFTTPPNRYTTNGADATQMDAVRTANLALADFYGAPICDLMKLANFNINTYGSFTSDGTHPTQTHTTRIATILYNFLNQLT